MDIKKMLEAIANSEFPMNTISNKILENKSINFKNPNTIVFTQIATEVIKENLEKFKENKKFILTTKDKI